MLPGLFAHPRRMVLFGLVVLALLEGVRLHAAPDEDGPGFLPADFPVYVYEGGVVNWAAPGTTRRILPTNNEFRGPAGCYVACYSRETERAVYSVGDGIQVMGQVRVPGRYVNRVCQPLGFETRDISASAHFKQVCGRAFPQACDSHCWAGGDTGGWFGIQP